MTKTRHFVFAGGGSGGHLTPSIVVAEQLLKMGPECHVSFLTSGRAIDQVMLNHCALPQNEQCEIITLPVTQSPRIGFSVFHQTMAMGRSLRLCQRLLRQRPANVVIGTGAFASLPALMAAAQQKIPIALFEANATPGRVNRWWSKRAAARFSGWLCSESASRHEFEFVGMPTIAVPRTTRDVANDPRNGNQLLIVGGSQGSRRLNELAVSAVSRVGLPSDWRVVHQTGSGGLAVPWPDDLSGRVQVTDFITNMPQELYNSTIVISRAGAVTLSEITAAGRTCVLVPMRTAAGDHQQANAERLANAGAAIIINEDSFEAVDKLVSVLQLLMNNTQKRLQMQQQISSLHYPGAGQRIARRLLELADRCETS